MPANKMPEMPGAVAWIHTEDLEDIHEGTARRDAPAFASPDDVDPEYRDGMNPLYTADQMRAMWLAGIADAKACVPDSTFCDEQFLGGASSSRLAGFGMCRDQTLANLSALEQGVGK